MTLFAAVLTAVLGLWVYQTIFRPLGERPAYVNTHSDSMLYATAVVIVLARWNERRDAAGTLLLGLLPLFAAGIYANNRRIVFVSLAVALITVYFLAPWNALKRTVTRAALLALPLIPLYVAVGWNSSAKPFKPVQSLKSVVSGTADRSTATRDIENYNLMVTLRTNPLLGTGFGHEYVEESVADDISGIFPQYRFIPHNSLMGLLAFGGFVGFTLVWMPMLAGMYLAVRSYRQARRPIDRTAALTVISVIIIFVNQAYGDMGLQSWLGTFLMAASLTVAGKLAVAVGAWPQRAPFRRPAPLLSVPQSPEYST
jgi:O-antigen ligase